MGDLEPGIFFKLGYFILFIIPANDKGYRKNLYMAYLIITSLRSRFRFWFRLWLESRSTRRLGRSGLIFDWLFGILHGNKSQSSIIFGVHHKLRSVVRAVLIGQFVNIDLRILIWAGLVG